MSEGIDRYIRRLEAHMGARYSPDTVRTYILQSNNFLQKVGARPHYTREDVLGYVDSMIEKGLARQSIHTAMAALRKLFQAIDCPWPLAPRELHLPLPPREGRPALGFDEVVSLIKGAKQDIRIAQIATALATVYGLRTIEIKRFMDNGCKGDVVDIQSAKGGRVRHHRIPPELTQLLRFPRLKISRRYIHKVFDQLMGRYVRPREKGEGWHAVRRAVVTGLLDAGVPMHTISRFMGWKMPQTAFTYYRPSQEDLDGTIYENHPFLGFWR